MKEILEEKYRNFFKEGHFKACHILYLAAKDKEIEGRHGKFDYISIARLEEETRDADIYQKYKDDIINKTRGIYEFICAIEEVLGTLSWSHGDRLIAKYAKGETVRSEIVKRALDNFIKSAEDSDVYDFIVEGERQLDRINALAGRAKELQQCMNAVKVTARFRKLKDYDYMEHFFEFREKFRPVREVTHKNLKTKVKDYGEKVGVYAKEQIIFDNETRKYHLMEGNREILTKDTPAFVIKKKNLDIKKLHITETVVADCGLLGQLISCVEDEADGMTYLQALPVEEQCVYYELLENSKVIDASKEPVFCIRKKAGATYNIRICLDEDELALKLMMAKDLRVGKKSKLERYLELGSGSEMYFITRTMDAFRRTDAKGYEKMMSFRRSKDEDLIKKTFGTLSILLEAQSPLAKKATA